MKSELICGDCLKEMPKLTAGSIDLVLTDLPYGVTQNAADICLPLDRLWVEWKRLLKPDGVVILTSQFPYTIDLILSNRNWFRYDLVWDKILSSGFLNANRMPLRVHEHILVFSEKQARYFPQKQVGPRTHSEGIHKNKGNNNYGQFTHTNNSEYGCLKFPTSIIRTSKLTAGITVHPTEKPVELAEYLIKTYTLENDSVLDCCMGVGWSAVAAKKLNRNFTGFDINSEYVETTKKRVVAIPERLEVFLGLVR
jgi:site-specific DNA-methyltransferase (adenine-specific)